MNGRQLVESLAITSKPDWACVVANPKIGYGVYSWHRTKEEAQHNANILEGTAVPVDYIGGELIVPPLAKATIKACHSHD